MLRVSRRVVPPRAVRSPPGDTYSYEITYVDASGHETARLGRRQRDRRRGRGHDYAEQSARHAGWLLEYQHLSHSPNGTSYFKLANVTPGGSYTDDGSTALSATPLDTTSLSGNYSYVITYYKAGVPESRPSLIIGPQNIVSGRIELEICRRPPPGAGRHVPGL